MTQPRANRRSQDEWFQLIQECRSSGLSDRTWCEQHGILVSSFYNAVKRLRKSACDIPLSSNRRTYALDLTSASRQEAVRIDICPDPYPEAVPPAKQMCPASTLTIHIRLSLWWIMFPLKSAIQQIRSFCSRSSGCCVQINVSGYLRCRCYLYRDWVYWHEKIYRWFMRSGPGTVPCQWEPECTLSVLWAEMRQD